jgi:DNA ligase (NAD+)
MKLSEVNTYTKGKIQQMSITMLEKILTRANELYAKGKSPLTDKVYDNVEAEVRRRNPKSPLLRKVGVEVKGRKKVRLPYPLFSLSKIRPEHEKDLAAWKRKHPGPYVISHKEDGISLEIIYEKKKLSKIYTRGNGTIGQDVTHLGKYLKIPKTVPAEHLAVRAELAMSEAAFDKHAKGTYENARNLVAGLANRLNSEATMLKHAEVLAYEVIEPRIGPSKGFAALKRMGFETAPHTVVPDITMESLGIYFARARKSSKYAIDGIVVENNDTNPRPSAGTHSPEYAFAFKMQDADDTATVVVSSIDWEESKHGKLQPVIEIPPTRLAGVTVKNVSGHNAFFIKNGFRLKDSKKGMPVKPIGPGAVLRVIRSGDVIPFVVEVVKAAKAPGYPKVPFKWDAKGVNILLEGSSDLVRDKRITAFFTALDIEGVKLGVVQKLTAAGYTSIIKILRADAEDFLEIPGFKRRSAEKLEQSIKTKTRAVELPMLMEGSGLFGPGFGKKRFDMIVAEYPKILSQFAKLTPSQISAKVRAIHGFEDKTATAFSKGFHKFTKWLRISKITPVLPKAVKVVGSRLKGESVCFTGFRDKAVEAEIKKQGGTIASGVTSNTTILVYAPGKASSKLQKAKDLGIKTYTPDQFKTKYNL